MCGGQRVKRGENKKTLLRSNGVPLLRSNGVTERGRGQGVKGGENKKNIASKQWSVGEGRG